MQNPHLNQRVVRSKGDYVIGRTGTILDITYGNRKARVDWDGDNNKTWVSFDVIEPEERPYRIDKETRKIIVGRHAGDMRTYKTYIPL